MLTAPSTSLSQLSAFFFFWGEKGGGGLSAEPLTAAIRRQQRREPRVPPKGPLGGYPAVPGSGIPCHRKLQEQHPDFHPRGIWAHWLRRLQEKGPRQVLHWRGHDLFCGTRGDPTVPSRGGLTVPLRGTHARGCETGLQALGLTRGVAAAGFLA